jgi:hypothetical protein
MVKMYNTTKDDFLVFKDLVHKYVDFFGIHEWEVVVVHDKNQGNANSAECSTCMEARKAVITLCAQYKNIYPDILERIKESAFHEVMELLLAPLFRLYSDETSIQNNSEGARLQDMWEREAHALIQRLIHYVMPLVNLSIFDPQEATWEPRRTGWAG